jgi:hypothetical protein
MPAVLALASSWGLSPLAPLLGPLLAGRRTRLGLLAGGLLLALSQARHSAYSAEVPQRLSLVLGGERAGRSALARGLQRRRPAPRHCAALLRSLRARAGRTRGLVTRAG